MIVDEFLVIKLIKIEFTLVSESIVLGVVSDTKDKILVGRRTIHLLSICYYVCVCIYHKPQATRP